MTSDLFSLKVSIVLKVYLEINEIKLTAFGFAGSIYPKSGSSMLATSKSDPSASFTDVTLFIYLRRPILFVCSFVYNFQNSLI
jgi:hypothetical protein